MCGGSMTWVLKKKCAFVHPKYFFTHVEMFSIIYNFPARAVKKSNLYYTHGIAPKLATGDEVHLGDIEPGQHRNVAAVANRFDQPGNGPRAKTFRVDSEVFTAAHNRCA